MEVRYADARAVGSWVIGGSSKVLFEKGVKIDAMDDDGQTALHLAAANGQMDAMKVRPTLTRSALSPTDG